MAEQNADSPHVMRRGAAARNARTGLILFFPYLLFYAGFVAMNTFASQRMGEPAFMGLNLAIVYGFALIVGAFLLAIVYLWLCRSGAVAAGGEGGR